MTLRWLCTYTLLFALALAPSVRAEEPTSREEIDLERLSEMLGHLVGSNLEGPGFVLDQEAIIRGIRMGVAGDPAPMELDAYQSDLEKLQEFALESHAADNLLEAEAFLKENGQHDSIIELEPGKLQYRVIQEGEGALVTEESTPLIHFTGRYHDGTIFGSSADSEPIVMPLDQTIPGFARGIIGMREGEKRMLYIHPELAYGEGGAVPPNSLLVFEVEILKADTREAEEVS